MEKEGRLPTEEERKVLAKYVGWGQFSQKVFNRTFSEYLEKEDRISPEKYFWRQDTLAEYEKWLKKYGSKLHPKAGGLLTQEEWDAASKSTMNAHWTTKEIIQSTWDLIEHLGFKGGDIVEPSAGVGHWFGLMPKGLSENSNLHAVELDPTTGRILGLLYPDARVQVTGFEKARGFPDNSMDLVVSNFPFGRYPIFDKAHPEYSNWHIHNYFFARSIDAVRPGGLVVGITSHYTMDAVSGVQMREYLGKKADLVAAIRLPYNAFLKNAGTEVTTDILVFRKKVDGKSSEGADFRVTKEVPIGENTAEVNEYFLEHPDMVLGTHSLAGTMHGANEYRVDPREGQALDDAIREVMKLIPKDVYGEKGTIRKEEQVIYAEGAERENTLVERDGKFYTVIDGQLKEPTVIDSKGKEGPAINNKGRERRVRGYMRLREHWKRMIDALQKSETTDEEAAKMQRTLNDLYDDFVRQNKEVGNVANSFLWKIDSEFPVVAALEDVSTETVTVVRNGKQVLTQKKTFKKAAAFERRTIFPWHEPITAESIDDGLKISMVYKGKIDPEYIGKMIGRPAEDVQRELVDKELAYSNPETGLLEPPDKYLSGNVRKKLIKARAQVDENPALATNVKALEAVQPAPIDIEFVGFKLGVGWMPHEAIQDFLQEVMGVEAEVRKSETGESVRWGIRRTTAGLDPRNTEIWGTSRRTGDSLVQDCLNLKRTSVYDWDRDTKTRTYNAEDTLAAREKQDEIQEKFKEWLLQNDKWAQEASRIYNEEKNGQRLRKREVPDIQYFPGASHARELQPHQKVAVVRGLEESTLFAYGVGTGKTYIYVTLAMEMKRLQTARKPMLVVHNSTIGQYAKVFKMMYPQSRVLIPDEKQRSSKYRRRLLGQIASGDWDAVVLPQSFFDGIADDPKREAAFIREQIRLMEETLEEFRQDEDATDWTVKEMENMLAAKEAKLEALKARRKDDALTFEQLGVDALLIDEAHSYKRSDFFTKLMNVKGIDKGSSQKSVSLLLKSQYVRQKTGGKNVVMATGTPISNTIAEFWTMLRYIRPEILQEYGANLFDNWAASFAESVIDIEETAMGTYKNVERFRKYSNGPELLTMFHTVADVMLTKDADLKLPAITGGKPTPVVIERSKELAGFINHIRKEYERWDALTGREKRFNRHVPLVLYGLAKKAAVDLRLVSPVAYKADPNGKLAQVANNIHKIWKETEHNRSTQIVFLDLFHSRDWSFNAHDELKRLLVEKGIPAEEVAIKEEAVRQAQQDAMLQGVRSGKIRVIIGSTEKLGIGVNIQAKLIAAHHVDAPPRPMDIEQRNGRIVRQKNENPEVQIYVYGVKQSLDSVLYDRNVKKQKAVDQVLTGQITGRTFEDPLSEAQMSLAEMNAAFAGDPILFEKNSVQQTISQLRISEQNHMRRVSDARIRARELDTRTIQRDKADIQEAEWEAKEARTAITEDGKLIEDLKTVDGKPITRAEIMEAVKAAWERSDALAEKGSNQLEGVYDKLIEKNGKELHEFKFKAGRLNIVVQVKPNLVVAGVKVGNKLHGVMRLKEPDVKSVAAIQIQSAENGEYFAYGDLNTAGGTLQRVTNLISGVLHRQDAAKEWLTQHEAELKSLREVGKESFAKAAELDAAERRMGEIEAYLRTKEMEALEKEAEGQDDRARDAIANQVTINVPEDDTPEVNDPAAIFTSGEPMINEAAPQYAYINPSKQAQTSIFGFKPAPEPAPEPPGLVEQAMAEFDKLAAEELKKAKAGPKLAQYVKTETTGDVRWSGTTIHDAGDVASLLAGIRKGPQEFFYSVVTDENGIILEVHKYSKGTSWSGPVIALQVVGRAMNVPGAAKIHFVHNHPSGETELSPQDRTLGLQLQRVGDFGGLEWGSFIVLGATKYQTADEIPKPIPAAMRKVSIPVVERKTLIRTGLLAGRQSLTDAKQAEAAFITLAGGSDGVMLLDRKSVPLTVVPFVKGRTMAETTKDILAIAEKTNASAAVIKIDDDTPDRVRYATAFVTAAQTADLTVLDVLQNGTYWMREGYLQGLTNMAANMLPHAWGVATSPLTEETRLAVRPAESPNVSMTYAQFQEAKGVIDDVVGWLKRVLPSEVMERLTVELKPFISIEGRNVEKTLREHGGALPADRIAGATTFNRLRALIELSYRFEKADMQETAYHEAFHVVAKWLLPNSDYQALLKHYKTEEAAAKAFAKFAMAQKGTRTKTPTFILGIFWKVRRYLQIVKNGLIGKGFARPEDVFARIWTQSYRPRYATGGAETRAKIAGLYRGQGSKVDRFEAAYLTRSRGGTHGWGLYLTEEEGAAKYYAEKAQGVYDFDKPVPEGKEERPNAYVYRVTAFPHRENEVVPDEQLAMKEGHRTALLEKVRDVTPNKPSGMWANRETAEGNKAELIDMLETGRQQWGVGTKETTYAGVLNQLGRVVGKQRASKLFAEIGIDGLSYEEGTTTNFVLFDPSEAQIEWVQAYDAISNQYLGERETRLAFAGEGAETANKTSLAEAKAMEARGATTEQIRQKTGWFRAPWKEGEQRGVAHNRLARDAYTFHGKPFSVGVYDTRDGKIEQVVTYAEAEEADWHHNMWVKPRLLDRIENGEAEVFWMWDADTPMTLKGSVPKPIADKILEQISQSNLGKWRFEIDDSKAKVNAAILRQVHASMQRGALYPTTLERVYDFPALYEAYPQLRHMKIIGDPDIGTFDAYWAPGGPDDGGGYIALGPGALLSPGEAKKSLTHEITHITQLFEGWAPGGSPNVVKKELRIIYSNAIRIASGKEAEVRNPENRRIAKRVAAGKTLGELRDEARRFNKMTEWDIYRLLAGEFEAREASARAGMGPQERLETKPYTSENIHPFDIIVREDMRPGVSFSIRDPVKWSADEWVKNVIEKGRHANATQADKDSAARAQEAKDHFEGKGYRDDVVEAAKTVIKGAQGGELTWRGKKVDTSVLERWIASPEYYFEKVPAAWRVLNAALEREDDYHRTYMALTANDADLVALRQFKDERPAEYEKLMKVMVHADRNRIDWTETELRKRFSGEAVAAWKAYRDMMNRGFDALTAEMNRIIATCEKLGVPIPEVVTEENGEPVTINLKVALAKMGDLRGSYMPRSRPSKRLVLMATRAGANPIREHFDLGIINKEDRWWKQALNRWTPLERRVKQLTAQGYEVTVEESRDMPEDVFQLAGRTVAMGAMVNEALKRGQREMERKAAKKAKTLAEEATLEEAMAEWDRQAEAADITALFANELATSIANIVKARGFRASMVKRGEQRGQDVWIGYETDILKSAAQYVSGLSAGIAKRNMASKMMQAISGTDINRRDFESDEEYVRAVETRRIDPTQQKNIFHDVTTFMENMLRNEEFADRVIGTIKGLAVVKYLGGRLSAPVVNLSALLTSVPGSMHGYANIPFGKGFRALGRAMADYVTWRWGERESLDADTAWIMDHIHERGWHNAQYNREALAVIRSKFGGAWSWSIDKLMLAFGATEQLNRISTIAGTYRALRDRGMDRDEAVALAKFTSDRAHMLYGKTTRPYLAQGKNPAAQAAQAFYVFSKFSHGYMQTMYDVGVRRKDRKAAAWMMVSPMILAGGPAMPIIGPMVMRALGMITALWDPDRPEEGVERLYAWLAENVGPRAEMFARFGLAGLAGLNIKGSIQIDPGRGVPTTLPELLGAPGSILQDMYYGGKDILRGDVYRGVERVVPRFVGEPMKAVREYAYGVTTRGNIPKIFEGKPMRPTGTDTILRILNFNPSHLAAIKEKKWAETELIQKYQDMRSEIYERLRAYYQQPAKDRSRDDYMEILADMNEYNRTISRRKLFALKGLNPISEKSIKSALGQTR